MSSCSAFDPTSHHEQRILVAWDETADSLVTMEVLTYSLTIRDTEPKIDVVEICLKLLSKCTLKQMLQSCWLLVYVTMAMCETKLKPLYLVALLQKLEGEKCIVFTSSVESTHRLCTLLNFFDDLPFKIKEYSGLQRQSVRSKTLKGFREGEIQVLVSSDAMTRGMDVEGVKNVINYDMPVYIKTYIHRAGRTARAGQAGRCFTLLSKDEAKHFKKLLQKADNNTCPAYSVPSSSVESMHSIYTSALEKLKETVEMEAFQKRKIGFKSSRVGKRSGTHPSKE
ncbi:hypothetical protein TIFTF001_023650 [Ficus carica]|uniref:Helicase C-terminal domain-containing protein n=1 Tax=Ficus carica TaxID=3494 RepID=A0AA88DDY9_FICCA|nr:hypothetical protein TIFTF001_023650 [Ficus carica]